MSSEPNEQEIPEEGNVPDPGGEDLTPPEGESGEEGLAPDSADPSGTGEPDPMAEDPSAPEMAAPIEFPTTEAEAGESEYSAGADLTNLVTGDELDASHQPEVREVEFSQVERPTGDGSSKSIDMLMDIKLPISVELGRSQAFVKEILDYSPGTVVELNKMAGDPVDILVNGRAVAKGEVVVIDDKFGVRITILLSPQDRVKSLAS